MNKKWRRRFLELADHIASWSKDPSTKVGAVIASDIDRKVVALGYNGFPRGVDDDAERYDSRQEKYPRIVHAEMNAILTANVQLDDFHTIYCTLAPCNECAKAIIQSGIGMVVTRRQDSDRWKRSWAMAMEMFEEAGVFVEFIDG